MKPLPNINRFDYTHSDFEGWRVSFSRFGEKFIRYFSDKKAGGDMEASLAQAKAYLSALKEILKPIPPGTRTSLAKKCGMAVNGSVYLYKSPGGFGQSSTKWVGQTGCDRKSFAVKKYGFEEAKQMAADFVAEKAAKPISLEEIEQLLREAREL